jgi:cyclase
MGRVLGIALTVVVLVAGYLAVSTYNEINSFETTRVTDDVHMISGLGGNVGILATDSGAVVVDTMTFRMQGEQLLRFAEKLGRGPLQAIINTHYHMDHTHGNPGFPAGSRVVSTQRTLDYLNHFDADYWEGDAGKNLPNETFDGEEHELRIGDKTIRTYHLGKGHTGGDLVVLFVEDKVLHAGDLVFNGRYPNIDLEAGGSVQAWGDTLDRVLQLDFDYVIPGHGPVTDRNGVIGFQHFMRELARLAREAAEQGQSLEEFQATKKFQADAGYEPISFFYVVRLDRRFVLRRAWEEATGAVTAEEVPAS